MSNTAYSTTDDPTGNSCAAEVFVTPTSFAQQQLWFIDQIDPSNPIYNLPSAFRVSGDLDHALLSRALNEVVSRHEVLRTTFRLVDGEPSQLIAPALVLRVPGVDLRALPMADRGRELADLIEREACAPFDLTAGPLMRATLVQIADSDSALLLTLHHIISDSWSVDVLMRELTTAYEAFRNGEASPMPELPFQYADFASWQREQLSGENLEGGLAYWKQKLAGLTALTLPSARRRSASSSHRGRTLPVEIPEPLTAALKQLAAQESVSLFMLMLAAWKTLLFRYTAQSDVCVGSPISNRSVVETEPLIGFFLNTLVLRTECEGNPGFRELLGRVRETVLGAFEHQEVPFDLLVETLHPARDAGQNPLFNVAFVLVHGEATAWSLPGLTFAPIAIEEANAKFDLMLGLVEWDGKMSGTLTYNTELFDEDFIARMSVHLRNLLEEIAANPDAPIDTLPLLDTVEREQLVSEGSGSSRSFPAHQSVHALFEEQVAHQPGALAVEAGEERVTYEQLNQQANQLARHLRALGVLPGACVGVCMERSAELIACLLAIGKAGGIYVPLDAASPPERLALMLAESGAALVLTRTDGLDRFAETTAQAIDCDAVDYSQYDAANLGLEGGGEDPAYVIFTSGSTGEPKGVVVPHRAIARLVLETDYIGLTPDDVIAHASNAAFDAATFEIWGALLNGAKLVVAPRDILLSPGDFAAFLTGRGITTLFLTTALFNQIARQDPTVFRPIKHLLFGGEACNPDCIRRVLEHGAPQRLVHVYGPTEATTFASWHLVGEVPTDAVTVPIGKPIANTAIYLLDARLQPVPHEVVGEIFIGGPGLALGYLNDPNLTAERFPETPFGRLYRTGDLAKRNAHGVIEFRGRADQQIKLRGFRIEPGEIEVALQRHPGVRQAAVIVREIGQDRALVAYLVTGTGDAPDDAEMREFLHQHLPAPMVPAAFVRLPALPLTSNGKLNHNELPEPTVETRPMREYAPPQNSVHAHLIEIWEEVLNRKPIGIRDDFFDLGGHSLLAARVIAMSTERLGHRLPFAEFFARPTIEAQARNLISSQVSELQTPYVLINPSGRELPVFFLHGDFIGGGFFCKTLARIIGSDRPFYALHPHGLQGDEVPSTIEAMAAERVSTIREIQPHGPYILGGYCNGSLTAYHAARLLRAMGEEVAVLLMLVADGSNIRFRWVKRAVEMVGAFRGEDEVSRQRRFLAVHRQYCARENLARYYAIAAAELWKRPTREQASRLWDKARRIVSNRTFRLKSRANLANGAASRGDLGLPADGAIRAAYTAACSSFVPESYDSPVVLLWPKDEMPPRSQGPTAGWNRVCAKLELVEVPGHHHSCIAQHANVLVIGEAMRRAIEKCCARHPLSC